MQTYHAKFSRCLQAITVIMALLREKQSELKSKECIESIEFVVLFLVILKMKITENSILQIL